MMIVMTIRIRIVSSIVVCGCGFRRLFVSCKTYQLNELTEELNVWSFNNFFSDLCIAYSLFESKAENFYKYSARIFFFFGNTNLTFYVMQADLPYVEAGSA